MWVIMRFLIFEYDHLPVANREVNLREGCRTASLHLIWYDPADDQVDNV